MKTPPCGSIAHNNIFIPANAKLCINKAGREFYVSGIFGDISVVRFTDDGTTQKIETKKIEIYL